MVILGIDPGYAIVGCGIVEKNGSSFKVLDFGAITTAANTEFSQRLEKIYSSVCEVIKKYNPDVMAIERLFFTTNQKTAIDVAQARGVIILAAQNAGVKVAEYTPLQVKQSVVGYGRATKKQVIEMTNIILNLSKGPKLDDVADALAIAICHGHSAVANDLMKNQL